MKGERPLLFHGFTGSPGSMSWGPEQEEKQPGSGMGVIVGTWAKGQEKRDAVSREVAPGTYS